MIRKAADTDLIRLCRMEEELFPSHPWKNKEFMYELHENPYSSVYVYDEDGIKGYVILWIMYEQAEIANIGVDPVSQNQHIGTELLTYCIKKAVKSACENMSLEVRISNLPAIHLYEKAGFIKINIRKKYYEDGEDAFLMLKPLGGLNYDDAAGD